MQTAMDLIPRSTTSSAYIQVNGSEVNIMTHSVTDCILSFGVIQAVSLNRDSKNLI